MNFSLLNKATLEPFESSKKSFYIMKGKVCLGLLFYREDGRITGIFYPDTDEEWERRE